jgi:hypothetical protein
MKPGTITFQANDKVDVFHIAEILENGIEASDETLLNVEDSDFESNKAWVSGRVPKMKPVNVDGDTTIINAWFKAESFDTPFVLRVYVECEMVEELESVQVDEKDAEEKEATRIWSRLRFIYDGAIHSSICSTASKAVGIQQVSLAASGLHCRSWQHNTDPCI